jgi:hypothetical protein
VVEITGERERLCCKCGEDKYVEAKEKIKKSKYYFFDHCLHGIKRRKRNKNHGNHLDTSSRHKREGNKMKFAT